MSASKSVAPPVMDEVFTTAVFAARGVIRNILSQWGRGDDVDDLVQITWESVFASHQNYDPALGSVEAWVTTIAKRRSLDHVTKLNRRSKLQERLVSAADGPEVSLSAVEYDFAESLIEGIDAAGEAREILAFTARLMPNPVTYRRAIALFVVYGEDIRRAATGLGLSEDIMRDSRRQVSRCAQVIRKALAARRDGKAATLRTLMDCLPVDGEEAGAWATALSKAVVRAGGFHQVRPEDLVGVTGFSFHTCRQYLTEAHLLLQIAMTVLSEKTKNDDRASQEQS